MTPVGLDAFKKNEITCLGQMPDDNDPEMVVVEMMKKRAQLPLEPQQTSLPWTVEVARGGVLPTNNLQGRK